MNQSGFYGKEHIFLNASDEIIGYAVEVDRPVLDLNSLIEIWKSPSLQEKKSEAPSNEKVLYLINQIHDLVTSIRHKGIISHGNLRPSSFFIDL